MPTATRFILLDSEESLAHIKQGNSTVSLTWHKVKSVSVYILEFWDEVYSLWDVILRESWSLALSCLFCEPRSNSRNHADGKHVPRVQHSTKIA